MVGALTPGTNIVNLAFCIAFINCRIIVLLVFGLINDLITNAQNSAFLAHSLKNKTWPRDIAVVIVDLDALNTEFQAAFDLGPNLAIKLFKLNLVLSRTYHGSLATLVIVSATSSDPPIANLTIFKYRSGFFIYSFATSF